ncbi:hypothetical protein [uncultured Megasphaera sp.]|uniref:hypothetical protein n=1 Tax=uncultured Megasphaera sp. TaxID=165188 RepID=UPI002673313D|nr:hypothetical protein [uncultured Megasphaera sp.]
MTQRMSIGVASQADDKRIAVISCVSIRERLLRFLLGRKEKITIIVPGDSVKELTIHDSIGKGALP